MGLSTKKKIKKTHDVYFKALFERKVFDTAHANLELDLVHPVGNSRVNYEVGSSFSDEGSIIQYTTRLYQNGQLISEKIMNPEVDGTYYRFIFKEIGNYQVELEVLDSTGDTDTVRGEIIAVTDVSPDLEYQITQNENFKDIFDIDLSGSKANGDSPIAYYGIIVYQNGEWFENFWYDSSQDINEIKTIQTKARGDINFTLIVETESGTNNNVYTEAYQISIETPPSLFLNYSHEFLDEYNPRAYYYAFSTKVSEQEFKKFNIKVTNELGEISYQEYNNYDIWTDGENFIIHAIVTTPVMGTSDVEITLETNDGRISYPFKDRLTKDIELGTANLVMEITSTDPNDARYVSWVVDLEKSDAGYFGNFEKFTCTFIESETGEELVFEEYAQAFYFEIPRGLWDVTCIGETSAGLISTNTINTTIDARNKAPVINSVQVDLTDPIWKFHDIWIDFTDDDGWVEYTDIKITSPSGIITEASTWDYYGDNFLEEGSWTLEVIAYDNEGAESNTIIKSFVVTNAAPTLNPTVALVDEATRLYQLDFNATDSDGYISMTLIISSGPSGIQQFEVPDSFSFNITELGDYNLEFIVEDNLGKRATEVRNITVSNKKPSITNFTYTLADQNERIYDFNFQTQDIDGWIANTNLKLTSPSGLMLEEIVESQVSFPLKEEGIWTLTLISTDNEGAKSTELTQQIEIINIAPTISDVTITELADRRFKFDIQANDEDGFIAKYAISFTDPNGINYSYEVGNPHEDYFFPSGVWNLTFKVTDNMGKSTEFTKNLEIINNKPTTDFEILTLSETERLYQFRPTLFSDDHDEFPSNAELMLSTPTGVTLTYSAFEAIDLSLTTPGTYHLSYRVFDSEGLSSDSIYKTVEVINQMPVPVINITRISEDRIYLIVEESYDLDGSIVEHSFEFIGPNGEYEARNTFGSFEINLASAGAWKIIYGVKDNDGAWSDLISSTFMLDVLNLPPRVQLSASPIDLDLRQYQVSGGIQDDSSSYSYIYKIFSPDGEYIEQDVTEINFTYYFNQYGTWNVELIAIDAEGITSTTSIDISTINSAPEVILSKDKEKPVAFEVIELTARESTDINNDQINYNWVFEDGTTKKGETIYHFFEVQGLQTVTVIASDSYGASSSKVIEIDVQEPQYAPPEADFIKNGDFDNFENLRGPLYLSAISSSSLEGEIVSYQWFINSQLISNEKEFQHEFQQTGSYSVELLITNEYNMQDRKKVDINVSNILSPSKVISIYELSMVGLNLDANNPILNNVQLTLEGSTAINENYKLFLNEIDVTNSFIQDGTTLTGSIDASDGFNILSVYLQDENENYIRENYEFYAGSINKTITFLDKDLNPIPQLQVTQSFEDSNLKDFKVSTDDNGKINLTNHFDLNSNVIAHKGRLYTNEVILKGSYPTTIILSLLDDPKTDSNHQFQEDINGWDLSNINHQITELDNKKYLSIEPSTSGLAELKRHFIKDNGDSFIQNEIDLTRISIGTIVQVSLENLTTGVRDIKIVRKDNESITNNLKFHIWADQGDEIMLKVKIIRNENTVLKHLRNLFNAYANSDNLLRILQFDFHIIYFDVELQDLNNKGTCINYIPAPCAELQLTHLAVISTGEYINSNNRIYASIEIKDPSNAIKDITLLPLKISQNGSDPKSVNIDGAFVSRAKYNTNIYGQTLISILSKDQLIEDNTIEAFTHYFEIESGILKTNSPVRFKSMLSVDFKNGSERTYSNEVEINRTLTAYNVGNNYYGEVNNNDLDNGDKWATELTKAFLDKQLNTANNSIGLKIGDITNINGAGPGNTSLENRSIFYPHSWHHDGNRFDMQSSNFKSLSNGMRFNSFMDLKKILKTSKETVQRINADIVSEDPKELENYENYCLLGKTIEYLYIDSQNFSKNLRGLSNTGGKHRTHWHFKLQDIEGTDSYFSKFNDNEPKSIQINDVDNGDEDYLIKNIASSNGNPPFVRIYYKEPITGIIESIMESPETYEILSINDHLIQIKMNKEYLTKRKNNIYIYTSLARNDQYGSCEDINRNFSLEYIDDCNADGELGDIAFKNKDGGYIGVEYEQVIENSDLEVTNNARFCSGTVSEKTFGTLTGDGLIIENVDFFDNCSYITIETSGKTLELATKANSLFGGLRIKNSKFCENNITDEKDWLHITHTLSDEVKSIQESEFSGGGISLHNIDANNMNVSAFRLYVDTCNFFNDQKLNYKGSFNCENSTITNTPILGAVVNESLKNYGVTSGLTIVRSEINSSEISGAGWLYDTEVRNSQFIGDKIYYNSQNETTFFPQLYGGKILNGSTIKGVSAIGGIVDGATIDSLRSMKWRSGIPEDGSFSGTVPAGCHYGVRFGHYDKVLCDQEWSNGYIRELDMNIIDHGVTYDISITE